MTATNQTPDLEIYLLKPDPDAVRSWLEQHLGALETAGEKDEPGYVRWVFQGSLIVLTLKADGNFASLWFKQNNTPWAADIDCARSAHEALQTEIRCSATEWSESGDENQPGWVKITRGVEKSFDW